jgi:DeoR/GlpR family transcriptional regulator of sugar metabolism
MTRLIVNISGLTVVTNSTTVADAIATLDPTNQVSVILTGGVRTPSAALVGPVADRTLASMHVDQLFLGVHGMDERIGFTTPNLAEAATDRALIACAREVIVLADSSKWGVVGLADIAPLSAAHTVITDDKLPNEASRVLRDRVASVVVVRDETDDDTADGVA